MKQFPIALRTFAYPVLMGLAIVVSGLGVVLSGQTAQAISSSAEAHKAVLLEKHDLAKPASAPVLFPSDQATMVNPECG